VALFSADRNLGLAKQCVAALMQRLIRTLTETYVTLSLPHIADMVYLSDAAAAEDQVRAMIVAGRIRATIDAQRSTVQFIDHSQQYDSKDALLAMERTLQQVIGLASKMHGLVASLSVDHNFVARVTTQEGQPQQWEDEAMPSK